MPEFEVVSPFQPAGDQPAAIAGLVEGRAARRPLPDAAGHHRQRQDGDDRLDDRAGAAADARHRAEQVARRAARRRSSASCFPKNRVEYFVSYYDYYQPEAYLPDDRHLHREGLVDQRRDRPAPPRDDVVAAHAPRRDRRRLGLVHLRPRLARGVPRPDRRRCAVGEEHDQRALLRRLVDMHYDAQRHEPRARHVPGPRRHHRDPPRLRGDGGPARVLRRQARADRPASTR